MSDGSSDDSKKDPKKDPLDKDLTGLLELSAIMPPASAEELLASDPFSVNELPPVEQVDEFESIDQLGMTDHAPEEPDTSSEKTSIFMPVTPQILNHFPVTPPPIGAVFEDPFQNEGPAEATRIFAAKLTPFDDSFMASDPNEAAGEHSTPLQTEPKLPIDPELHLNSLPELNDPHMDFMVEPDQDPNLDFHPDFPETSHAELSHEPPSAPDQPLDGGISFIGETPTEFAIHEDPFADLPAAAASQKEAGSGMDGLKTYSERARESSVHANQKNPFHLWMVGSFDPFARDKLLLFITENPMGLNSSELDRQINAGRVFLPRISEFAGIKLIQDLRDSGLSFKLRPSGRDEDDVLPQGDNIRLQYESETLGESGTTLPVFPANSADPMVWLAFDSIQIVQFLKAEIIEVERSEVFQELLERMTTSLKNKARLKGAGAIGALVHELKPLRLPSHYQLEIRANLLKKL